MRSARCIGGLWHGSNPAGYPHPGRRLWPDSEPVPVYPDHLARCWLAVRSLFAPGSPFPQAPFSVRTAPPFVMPPALAVVRYLGTVSRDRPVPWSHHLPPSMNPDDIFAFQSGGRNRWTTTNRRLDLLINGPDLPIHHPLDHVHVVAMAPSARRSFPAIRIELR